MYSFVIGLVRFIYYFVPKSNWTTRCATIDLHVCYVLLNFTVVVLLFYFLFSEVTLNQNSKSNATGRAALVKDPITISCLPKLHKKTTKVTEIVILKKLKITQTPRSGFFGQ